jgi:hypothetical protein
MLAKLCYRGKDRDMTTYLQLRKIRDPFFTLKKLEELRHPHDPNKCENVMKIITKFHPKDIQLYNTICCKGQIFGSISKDSGGMASYLAISFTTLGVVMLAPTLEYARQKDYRRVVDKKFKVNIKAKTSRAKIQSTQQRAAYKMALDPKMKSYEYRSGIHMEIASQEYEKEKERKEKQAEDDAVELALTGKQVVTGN